MEPATTRSSAERAYFMPAADISSKDLSICVANSFLCFLELYVLHMGVLQIHLGLLQ
jgi:hypothetical protein